MWCAGFVVDHYRATNGANGCGINVEGTIVVFPSTHGRGDGGLVETVKSELCLWEELVPKVVVGNVHPRMLRK